MESWSPCTALVKRTSTRPSRTGGGWGNLVHNMRMFFSWVEQLGSLIFVSKSYWPCVFSNFNNKMKSIYSRSNANSVGILFPSKITWDLTNGPLSKLLELLDTQVCPFNGSCWRFLGLFWWCWWLIESMLQIGLQWNLVLPSNMVAFDGHLATEFQVDFDITWDMRCIIQAQIGDSEVFWSTTPKLTWQRKNNHLKKYNIYICPIKNGCCPFPSLSFLSIRWMHSTGFNHPD